MPKRADDNGGARKGRPTDRRAATPIDAHVGSRIRLRRMELEMSQEQVAHQLGITFQQVQKYERGTNRIGAGRLHAIAQALDVPVGYFFEGAVGPSAADDPGQMAPLGLGDPAAVRLLRAFARIESEAVRMRAVAVIETIAGVAPAREPGGKDE